jgi:phage terminase large subunit
MLDLEIPGSLRWLFEQARYKVAYGGRGGGKSWSFVRALLWRAFHKRTRILCAREIQDSIKESVHQLLKDQIQTLGQEDFFKVKETSITAINGSEFIFEGLRHNVDNIRSKEGIDIAAVFEAKNVSKASWEVLIPTVRQPGSEIWVEFNPELDTDETYKRFVLDPPTNAIVRKVNWTDNPWFPEILEQEIEDLKSRDYDAYLNVWEGFCRVTLEGAVYAKELREATEEGRIAHVAYDERVPVHTFWDLGWSDCTSIWFAQKVGFDYHVIDFYQNRLQKLPHYLKVLQDKPYVYGTDYLPHDADHSSLAADAISKQMKDVGRKVVTLTRIPNKQLGINATRTIFNRLCFDEVKCADGLQSLRHYKYDIDERGQWSKEPLHDEHSHAADALRTLGESIGLPDRKQKHIIEIPGAYDRDRMVNSWLET